MEQFNNCGYEEVLNLIEIKIFNIQNENYEKLSWYNKSNVIEILLSVRMFAMYDKQFDNAVYQIKFSGKPFFWTYNLIFRVNLDNTAKLLPGSTERNYKQYSKGIYIIQI